MSKKKNKILTFFKQNKMTKKEAEAIKNAKFLVDGLIIERMLTILYGPPSSGKTKIVYTRWALDIAAAGKEVIIIDADGNPSDAKIFGTFFAKYNNISYYPINQKGIAAEDIVGMFQEAITNKEDLSNVVFIIDTLKKFTDLMSKKLLKNFLSLMKQLNSLGATSIINSHSNKNLDKEGNYIFEGTNEIETECDCLLGIKPYTTVMDKSGKIINEEAGAVVIPQPKFRGIGHKVFYRWKVYPRDSEVIIDKDGSTAIVEKYKNEGFEVLSLLKKKQPIAKTKFIKFLRKYHKKGKSQAKSANQLCKTLDKLIKDGEIIVKKEKDHNKQILSVK